MLKPKSPQASFWKLKYGFSHAIHGFDHDKNPWEIEARQWSEQINKKGLNLYVGPATR